MVAAIRFKGLKALPFSWGANKQQIKFFEAAIALVRVDSYWIMDMTDNPDETTPFDQSENDTKLTLEIAKKGDPAFPRGLATFKERLIFILEQMRDNPGTICDFDQQDENGHGGIRRYVGVVLKIMPSEQEPDAPV